MRRPGWRGQAGQATAELAILTPLLLVVILGAVQFGLWRHAVNTAQAAAQEGARAARTQQGTPAAGQARAEAFLARLGGGLDAQVQVTRTPTTTRVEVAGTLQAILPGIGLPVRVVVESPTEVFRPDTPEPIS